MSETTSKRTARLLAMTNAQLVMHAQDLTIERDELLKAMKRIHGFSMSQFAKPADMAIECWHVADCAIASIKGES